MKNTRKESIELCELEYEDACGSHTNKEVMH